MKKFPWAITAILVLIFIKCYGQTDASPKDGSLLNHLDTYSKIFAAVLAGLGALFGLPLAVISFKKTRAEIKKLELEAQALEANSPVPQDREEGYRINIENSNDVNVQVIADPRLLGPLLLLLDFIVAWILLSLLNYVLDIFRIGVISRIITVIVGVIILTPILRESLRVRKNLKGSPTPENSED